MKRQGPRSPAPRIDRQLSALPSADDTASPDGDDDDADTAPPDVDDVLDTLSDNVRRGDAMITAAERLIEEPPSADTGRRDDDTNDDYLPRRGNHILHLVETAKLSMRAAIRNIEELQQRKA